jgi:hypothetical protein
MCYNVILCFHLPIRLTAWGVKTGLGEAKKVVETVVVMVAAALVAEDKETRSFKRKAI